MCHDAVDDTYTLHQSDQIQQEGDVSHGDWLFATVILKRVRAMLHYSVASRNSAEGLLSLRLCITFNAVSVGHDANTQPCSVSANTLSFFFFTVLKHSVE